MSALTGQLTTLDGWPVAGGTLTAVDAGGVQRARGSSGPDGRVVLEGLPHIGLGRVHGRLRRFSGHVQVADPLENSSVEVVIDPMGVDTAEEMRDEHLRSPDFLDALRYPEIRYKSDGLRRLDAKNP